MCDLNQTGRIPDRRSTELKLGKLLTTLELWLGWAGQLTTRDKAWDLGVTVALLACCGVREEEAIEYSNLLFRLDAYETSANISETHLVCTRKVVDDDLDLPHSQAPSVSFLAPLVHEIDDTTSVRKQPTRNSITLGPR